MNKAIATAILIAAVAAKKCGVKCASQKCPTPGFCQRCEKGTVPAYKGSGGSYCFTTKEWEERFVPKKLWKGKKCRGCVSSCWKGGYCHKCDTKYYKAAYTGGGGSWCLIKQEYKRRGLSLAEMGTSEAALDLFKATSALQ